jgi:hypothetical protein
MTSRIDEFRTKFQNQKNFLALVETDSHNYSDINIDVLWYFSKDLNIPGVYVVTNKPYKTIKEQMIAAGLNPYKMIFIDIVSAMGKLNLTQEENCFFIDTPKNLVQLGAAIDMALNAIDYKEKYLFFDSLTTLLIYNHADELVKFFHLLGLKIRNFNIYGIILSIEKKDDSIKERISQFCDIVLSF